MSKSPLPNILLGVLAILAVWSLIYVFSYNAKATKLRQLQLEVNRINSKQQILSLLVNDAVEYSKTHPAMEPVLQSVGISKTAQTAPVTPAKTGTK